ncbi:MAG: murein biosynthesis integral membrane protein MurJ [Anaerolineales bacterium]|nr:murein biosynthesis integral membrane protein MurJ [Anaerolineales bacterium]
MSHLARSTLIIAFFFGVEKVLGFIRQVLTARTFGLSAELDAFNAANNIPDMIFALISGGALAIAFIPVLSEYLQKGGRPAAWDLFSRIANLVFLTTAVLSVIVALLAHRMVQWGFGIAPGFDAAQQSLVADLMRLNLIATLLFSLSGLIIASLQANQHFLLPAIAPSMYDLGALFGVVILAPQSGYQIGPITLPSYGMGVYGLVYGIILGSAMFLAIQIPGMIRYQFRWTPAIDLHHSGVQQVLRLLAPRILTVLCIQVVFLAQDNIASRLAEGTISSLVYGWLFMQVPETLIGTALGTALLPTISEQITRQEWSAFRQSLNSAIRVILALTLPIAAMMAIVIRPVVQILGFDAAGTEIVVWTTRAFLLGLMGHALMEVAARAFYAQQNARTPLLAAALTTTMFIILAALLGPWLGAPGFGLANAAAYTAQALGLLYLVQRRFPGIYSLKSTLLRVVLGTALAALVCYAIMQLPYKGLYLTILSLAIGCGLVLPFIWKEIKLLVKL